MRRRGVGWRKRNRRRELAALTGALVTALGLLMWGAAPAAAGGPTSVLVVSTASTQTAALYYSDEEYEELEQLLAPPGTGTLEEPPETDLTASGQINVTWMLHDVTPWRLNRVVPVHDTEDVWIHTATNLPTATDGTWHRTGHPAELRALLEKLGVLGSAAKATEGASSAQSSASGTGSGSGSVAGSAAGPGSGARSGDQTDWWWVLPGAAAGAVLALVLRPFVSRVPLSRLRGEPGPRQELRDV